MTVEWIATSSALENVVTRLRGCDRYALDTEFLRERTYHPQLALLQLAWLEDGVVHAALVDPLAVDVAPLKEVLESEALAIVHAASQDLAIVERACGVVPTRLFDPQIAASFLGYEQASLGSLCEALIAVRVAKGDQLTDWTRRPLGEEARAYAAGDVLHLLSLHDTLTTELRTRGRLAWAEEECERHRSRERALPDPETAWWRLKGKARLQGRARGVAQALASWRERRAAELDRPTKTLLSDLAILALAGRPASDERDLQRARGIGRLDANTTRSLLEAIRVGLTMREPELKLPPKPPSEKASAAAVGLALAWAAQIAETHALSPAVLATRDDVAALVRGGESRLREGWRHTLLGGDLEALLRGEKALALDEGRLTLTPR
ncbi:MAG: HRDC domain-containing protein [Myxococcales bacterium]|nr:HRDC domain-containing protein [Myxococcales bacterium]